ncbi:MAG: hypothetical protein M1423_02090, partial [Acidobacteria bacterium]|nr:hypothetical protein [Acidobacteriota bacterium]
ETVRMLHAAYGGGLQNRWIAYVMLGAAVVIDVVVLTFSISICSYVARNGLGISGYVLQNAQILRVLLGSPDQGTSLSTAGIWGFIIPLLSWLTAHGVVLGIVEPVRLIGAAFVDRNTSRLHPGSAGARRAAIRFRRRVIQICGFAATGVAAFLVFRTVINFDKNLFQYELIDQTSLRRLLGGEHWATKHSPEQVAHMLRGTFLGQVVLHAGNFYMICLFVSAFFLVVAVHRAWHAGAYPVPIRPGNVAIDILTPGYPPVYPPVTVDRPSEVGPVQNPPAGAATPAGPEDQPDPPNPPQPPDTGVILDEPR